MERNRHEDTVLFKKRCSRTGEPFRRSAGDVCPISVLDPEDQSSAIVPVENRGSSGFPRPRGRQAIVTDVGPSVAFAGQGRTAAVAGQPIDERRVAPAGTA